MNTAALALIVGPVVLIAMVLVLRRIFGAVEGHVGPPPPEYEEAARRRDGLKGGHLWGDLPTDPLHR